MPSWESILSAIIALLIIIAVCLIGLQIFNTIKLSKQKNKFASIHKDLKVGSEVMLASGLYGKITLVKDDYVKVELAKDLEIKASRYSISQII